MTPETFYLWEIWFVVISSMWITVIIYLVTKSYQQKNLANITIKVKREKMLIVELTNGTKE